MNPLPTTLSTANKSLRQRGISCVRVALDVPLQTLFEYLLPEGTQASVGDRVIVPFGARDRVGVVVAIDSSSELPLQRLKRVAAVRTDAPRLPADWLKFMEFLAGYYQRPLGETVIAALPPRLRSVKPLPRKAMDFPKAPAAQRFLRICGPRTPHGSRI